MEKCGVWRELTGRLKTPKPERARKVTPLRLGAITHRREINAARNRRWYRRNRAVLLAREAARRAARAHLYRAGGVYYERRKADPVNKRRQAAYQRKRRAATAMERGTV